MWLLPSSAMAARFSLPSAVTASTKMVGNCKIEPGETPQQALVREIKEELDIDILVGELLANIEYDYTMFHLSMQYFWCQIVDGIPALKEHEAARWLDLSTSTV